MLCVTKLSIFPVVVTETQATTTTVHYPPAPEQVDALPDKTPEGSDYGPDYGVPPDNPGYPMQPPGYQQPMYPPPGPPPPGPPG